MNPNRLRRIAIGVVAALAAVLVVGMIAVAWWLYDPDPGRETGTDAHIHADPTSSAEGVAQAVVGQIFTWQPAAQEGPWDSLPPIADKLTGPLAQEAAQRPENEPLPKQWLTWAEDNSRIVGATELADSSGDETHKSVTVTLRQRVMHEDGDVTPLPEMNAVVELVNEPDGWKAESYELELGEE